jgi:hypothetical protein
MELWQRSRYISRIVSGQMRFRINNEIFYVRTPTRPQRCLADELFCEQLEEVQYAGAYTEKDLKKFLEEKGIWIEDDEIKLKTLLDDIDKLKVGLFEMRVRSLEQLKIRKALEKAKLEANRLEILKHSYDHISAIGIATSAKHKYLLGCSIFYENGPYWTDETGWEMPDGILDKIIFKINQEKISDCEFREIARSDPWRSTWNIQKHCTAGLFEGSAFDLTDDQKNLIIWSSIYESVREHPDILEEDIIADDDMLDGWMIIKRKDREKNHIKDADNLIKNDKIKNSTEVFVKVDNNKDAKKVIDLNDEQASQTFYQRMNTIKKKGVVEEQEMPDTAVRLHQERMELLSQQIKRNK